MLDESFISPEQLNKLIEAESIEELSPSELLFSFSSDRDIQYDPGLIQTQIDPRNDEPILFNPVRSTRPQENIDTSTAPSHGVNLCPICEGQTTGILDLVELSKGHTFINKNLFPVLGLPGKDISSLRELKKSLHSVPGWGLHFVQWTSSYHDHDWQNMPLDDCVRVMKRLVAIEKKLIEIGFVVSGMNSIDHLLESWFVSIIKNVGRAVGGSVEHGHQQVIASNIVPKAIHEDAIFKKKHQTSFSEYLLSENSEDLLIRDYGSAVLMVPFFMPRPYNMILALKNHEISFMHEMSSDEITAVAAGWKEAIGIFQKIMPSMKREVAYNIVTHNSHHSGLYFEFLPFTQARGGLEHLGLSICQADAYQVADNIKKAIAD